MVRKPLQNLSNDSLTYFNNLMAVKSLHLMDRALHTDRAKSDFPGFSFTSGPWSLSEALSAVCSLFFVSATSTERSIMMTVQVCTMYKMKLFYS